MSGKALEKLVAMTNFNNDEAVRRFQYIWRIKGIDEKLKERGEKPKDYITRYCYSDEERQQAIADLGPDPEITRFKGLGEISPDEFAGFIGPDIRLEQVTLQKSDEVGKLLAYYMGKNTMERQQFIIDNLVIEEDIPEDEEAFD